MASREINLEVSPLFCSPLHFRAPTEFLNHSSLFNAQIVLEPLCTPPEERGRQGTKVPWLAWILLSPLDAKLSPSMRSCFPIPQCLILYPS